MTINLYAIKDWKSFEGEWIKVSSFTPLADVDGDKVEAAPGMPYALMEVECWRREAESSEIGQASVVHREDFRSLWNIFEERGVDDEEEVLISFRPAKFLASIRRQLMLSIWKRGSFEKWYFKGGIRSIELPQWLIWRESR